MLIVRVLPVAINTPRLWAHAAAPISGLGHDSCMQKQHCERCKSRDSKQLTGLCVRWWDVMWDAAPGASFSRVELQMPPALTMGEQYQVFVSMQRCLSTCPGIELELRWSVCCRTTGIRRRSGCISYQQQVRKSPDLQLLRPVHLSAISVRWI